MMECCERTEADKKGGHLAKRNGDGQLVLRESAQCAKEDSQVRSGGCGLLWLSVCFALCDISRADVVMGSRTHLSAFAPHLIFGCSRVCSVGSVV
jgi:hypothetical protein